MPPKQLQIVSPETMIEVIRQLGIVPFFKNDVPGWSIEELTPSTNWFESAETLGPWDWKIDAVRTGDIAYGKFLGGKAAFATVEWYRELMNWRRSIAKYRMPLRERCTATTKHDKLMKVLSPIALGAINENGALEAKELRKICAERLTPTQLRSLGNDYKSLLSPCVKKNILDSLVQYLQMGTWTVIGDFTRVYRGPNLEYCGWQRASNTTPESLFATPEVNDNAPAWARLFESETGAREVMDTASDRLATEKTPLESRECLIQHVEQLFPSASRKSLEKVF